MADPMLHASSEILDEALDAIREAIAATPPDALNRAPADDANSVAVLVTHAMHSTRWWLSAATGAPMPARDRPSEFETSAPSVDDLLASFDAIAADCRALLGSDASFDPSAVREMDRDEPVTAGWALLHALEHLGEHVGHLQLTVQLSSDRRA
ncbi:MAG: DinB family protein [Actinomycetota bacterium]